MQCWWISARLTTHFHGLTLTEKRYIFLQKIFLTNTALKIIQVRERVFMYYYTFTMP